MFEFVVNYIICNLARVGNYKRQIYFFFNLTTQFLLYPWVDHYFFKYEHNVRP